jgi:hypothetical protein
MNSEQARKAVARDIRESACNIYLEDAYASHVTEAEKVSVLQCRIEYALEVENGQHDANFTVWQRMRRYTHGDCPALLA